MVAVITALEGEVVAAALVNIRRGAPNRSAPIARRLETGRGFTTVSVVFGEPVAGEDHWYAGPNDEYVWAGAVRAPEAGFVEAASGLPVLRRANGTIRPVPQDILEGLYGKFAYSEGQGGRIVPDPAWSKANIVTVIWAGVCGGQGAKLHIHKRARPYFEKVINAVAQAGLAERVITYDGGYVPRHIGWKAGRPLSRHSWGLAIDINARWNGDGATLAPLGSVGSVRELVPFFEAEGFAWGGRFEPDKERDGMHFELARTAI